MAFTGYVTFWKHGDTSLKWRKLEGTNECQSIAKTVYQQTFQPDSYCVFMPIEVELQGMVCMLYNCLLT